MNRHKGSITKLDDPRKSMTFLFNPTTYNEKRAVNWNLSEGQGQVLPLAQFGMVEPTTISFELFLFHHGGIGGELNFLRTLLLPKRVSRLDHYEQNTPNMCKLDLAGIMDRFGVFTSIDIKIERVQDLTPIHATASIEFVETSRGIDADVQHLKGFLDRADYV